MKIDIETNKKEFITLLKSTEREGVDYVIEDLEKNGFFTAPASAGHHLNVEGGLLIHSLNTCKAALMLYENMQKLEPTLAGEVKRESVILASLLHDVCKEDVYFRSTKKRKNVLGEWEDYEGYKVSYKNFPMGHGEKSVVLLLYSGLELNDDEMLAIRWHMGAFGLNQNSIEDMKNYDAAKTLYPLVSIVQCGDNLAASIMERNAEDIDNL